jgi:hypothetical protein
VATPSDLVRARPLLPDRALPWLIEPTVPDLDLAGWASHNRAQLDAWFTKHRALLFRGFEVRDAETFHRSVLAASNGQLQSYRDRTTPRETVGAGNDTSTIHPAD